MKKKILSSILCAIMALSCVACGKQESVTEVDSGKDYVYVPQYITLNEDEGSYYSDLMLKGNSLYYSNYVVDEKTYSSQEFIFQHSLEDGSVKQLPISIPENSYISGYSPEENGNITILLNDYSDEKVDEEGMMKEELFLQKFNEQGELVWDKDITSHVYGVEEDGYTRGLFVDEQGRMYVCMERAVLLFDAEGEMQGSVKIEDGWINNIGMGKDGKLYMAHYDYTSATGGMVLSEIDFQGKKIGATYQNIPDTNSEGLAWGITKDFLFSDGSKVYEYDLSTQTCEELFTWLDCDIDGSCVSYVGTAANGDLIAVINDWNTGDTELAKLVKTAKSELAQKEEIVIGTLFNNQEIQAAAVAFNKKNDKYRVVIQTYIDENNWDENSYETGMTNFQNALVSGTNCPDIVELSQLGEDAALAAKGVFEDLNPYLEQSDVVSRADFIESVLEGFSHDGKLISIPKTFDIQTLVGKTSVVGEQMGWTMADMMACAKKYPEAELLEGYDKSSVLYLVLMFSETNFINWEKGECYFGTEDFKQVLEFANLFPGEIDWENYDGSSRIEKLQTNAALLSHTNIYDLQEIQIHEAQFGEPVTFVGFPTTDGSAMCMLNAQTRYAMVSKSDNKEGAWAFIESYLANDGEDRYSWGIPSKKQQFEDMITEMTTPQYLLDENGEPILDENGEPISMSGGSSVSMDGWEYEYHMPTLEDAEILRDLVAVAKPISNINEEVINILLEEADAYFTGAKTVDEVSDIIQSRVQIYISENS